MEWDVKAILSDLGIQYITEGHRRKTIKGVASINEATKEDLSFCSGEGSQGILAISNSRAGIILCNKSIEGCVYPRTVGSLLIFLENPKLAFIRVINRMFHKERKNKISPRAVISETAHIGTNCSIGDYTVIGDYCEIGSNTIISDRVSLVRNCVVGNNCSIQTGATLGSDGFAFERDDRTVELEHFPSLGQVIVGNNVIVSSNCSVAAGSLSDTTIGDGTKLDSLVHVGHDTKLGKNCVLTASTVIGGRTVVGDYTWMGLNSTLKNKIKIGNKVIIGCGAAVIKDVVDGDIVAGVPAKSIKSKLTSSQLFSMTGESTRDHHGGYYVPYPIRDTIGEYSVNRTITGELF